MKKNFVFDLCKQQILIYDDEVDDVRALKSNALSVSLMHFDTISWSWSHSHAHTSISHALTLSWYHDQYGGHKFLNYSFITLNFGRYWKIL